MIPHDKELYDKAFALGYDYSEYDRLESLCLTQEGKDAIRDLRVRRYHEEEAYAGML